MGTAFDIKRHTQLLRADTHELQYSTRKARSLIYEKGLSVKSKYVENILKHDSLTPTTVSVIPHQS
jgi:hypothetical protein